MEDQRVRVRVSDLLLYRGSRSQLSSSFINRQQGLIEFVQDQLGLSQIQAKLLIYGNNCDTQNEVYNLLLKDGPRSTYLHLFCPGVVGLCLICEESVDSHSVISSVLFRHLMERIELSDRQNSEQGSVEQQPTEECSVCFNSVRASEIVTFNMEKHSICLQCFNNFLTEEINNGRVVDLKCPHCNILLKMEWFEELVDQRTFKKYKLFLSNKQIFSNPQLRWCPNPKCSKIVQLKNQKGKQASCVCGTVICVKCNRQAHPKMTCDQVFKHQVKEWSDAIDIQKCKKCKSVVEKVSGCNHMTCGFCKYEWCWLCGSTFSPIHFSSFNPFGCPGLQNGDHMSRDWGCLKLWMYRLGWLVVILILLPIIIPVGLLIAGPVLFISNVRNSTWYYYRGNCFKFWLLVMLVVFGLALDPIVWIGVLIYAIPQGVKYFVKYYQHRRQIEETSAQHLRDRLIEERLNQ